MINVKCIDTYIILLTVLRSFFLTVIRHEIDPRQRKEKNESVYLAGRATDCFHKHIYMYKIVHRVEKKRRGGGERREKRV